MSNLSLYLASVLIWGSTWLAITFQYGKVAPEVSVAYRFWLAAAILAAWCLVRRLKLRFTLREHGWLALQGALMFGVNYVCVYLAEQRIPSGLMAVIFSLLAILNLLGARLLFALAGTVASSLSNLVSQRNQKHGLPVMQGNAYSMLYGAAFVALYCWMAGRPFTVDTSFRYLGSLAFLALFGSVLAFGAYLTLIGRIGAGRAGYAMVAIPVVALALSTAFEHLHWEWSLALGAALCLAGNLLVLPKAPKPAEAAA